MVIFPSVSNKCLLGRVEYGTKDRFGENTAHSFQKAAGHSTHLDSLFGCRHFLITTCALAWSRCCLTQNRVTCSRPEGGCTNLASAILSSLLVFFWLIQLCQDKINTCDCVGALSGPSPFRGENTHSVLWGINGTWTALIQRFSNQWPLRAIYNI